MSKRNFSGSFSGKGYYIALILCAAAIGISGYLYYQNADEPQKNLDETHVDSVPHESGVQAVATQGVQNAEDIANANATVPADGVEPLQTAMPVSGEIVAEYAMDCLSYNQTTRDWRVHNGIDIVAEAGTAVCAAADGTVYTVYEDETMGTTVVIRHEDGYATRYACLAEDVPVKPSQAVTMGQTIGYVGQTALLETAIGDHVHFSVTRNDKMIDPADFLPAE